MLRDDAEPVPAGARGHETQRPAKHTKQAYDNPIAARSRAVPRSPHGLCGAPLMADKTLRVAAARSHLAPCSVTRGARAQSQVAGGGARPRAGPRRRCGCRRLGGRHRTPAIVGHNRPYAPTQAPRQAHPLQTAGARTPDYSHAHPVAPWLDAWRPTTARTADAEGRRTE